MKRILSVPFGPAFCQRHRLLFSLLCLGGLVSNLVPSVQAVLSQTEVFFPNSTRGGRVGIYAKSQPVVLNATAKDPARIHLAVEQKKGHVIWNFPRTRMLDVGTWTRIPSRRLILKLRGNKTEAVSITARWISKSAQSLKPIKTKVLFTKEKWIDVVMPLPPVMDQPIAKLLITFDKPGSYDIAHIAMGSELSASLEQPTKLALLHADKLTLQGQADASINHVVLHIEDKDQQQVLSIQVPVSMGRFSLSISKSQLHLGKEHVVTAEADGEVSDPVTFFAFPKLTGKQLPPVTRQGWDWVCQGKRFGFIGINYTKFNLGLSLKAQYQQLAEDIPIMASWGIRVVRLPINFGLIQVAPGIFPDNPRWAQIYREHHLDPTLMEQIDYFIALAAQHGIYSVIDWHGSPTTPYRYFLGGKHSDQKKGKPGTAIAWLAPTSMKRVPLDMENPVHRQAMADTHRWMAGHFKGNRNLLGIEVPYNEPHNTYMAVESNWRATTNQMIQAVHQGDFERLTMVLGPSYSHNNLLASNTWLIPDGAAGAGPHFYLANGPAPLRKDSKKYKAPWLARDANAVFSYSFAASMMPFTAAPYPFYNGESGLHGYNSLLPEMDPHDSTALLVQTQLTQEYAAGMSGRIEWTMWSNVHFQAFKDIYAREFRRFAPVFNAGPINRRHAEVLFIQNPHAIPSSNGHNFACVPLAKLVLDLHLSPVHYMTDDQFSFVGSAELSIGLEQVVASSSKLQYKAYIVDKRHLNPLSLKILKSLKAPVLWLDDAATLTTDQLASFLKQAQVAVDQRTPKTLQLIQGPEHLLVYRREEDSNNTQTIYPKIQRTKAFQLTDEQGSVLYQGEADQLAENGLALRVPKWQSVILRIK